MCSGPLEDKGWELRGLDQPASEVLLLERVLMGLGQRLPTMEDCKHRGSFVFGLVTSQVTIMASAHLAGLWIHQNHGCLLLFFFFNFSF